jgi:alkyl hydroperoxide reductase subunit AhpC
MTLNIGDQAPDFEAETTEGRICFYKWIGNRWCVLFSHPDEPAWPYKPAFDERNVRLIGLSINGVDSCARWASDIRAAQGFGPEFPIICDPTFVISDLWGVSKPANDGDVTKRTGAYNQIARSVFVIGPDKTIKLIMICERAIERNFYRIIRFIVSQQLVMGHYRRDQMNLEGMDLRKAEAIRRPGEMPADFETAWR